MDPIADAMMELCEPAISGPAMSFVRMVTCSVSEPRARFRRETWPEGMYVFSREDDDVLRMSGCDGGTSLWRPDIEDIMSDDWRRV